jgi:hypothetical protein
MQEVSASTLGGVLVYPGSDFRWFPQHLETAGMITSMEITIVSCKVLEL